MSEKITESRDMRDYTWIICGGCERVLDGVPASEARIATDGFMVIQEAGWKWNGVSWECDWCSATPEERERDFLSSGADFDDRE